MDTNVEIAGWSFVQKMESRSVDSDILETFEEIGRIFEFKVIVTDAISFGRKCLVGNKSLWSSMIRVETTS